MARFKIHGLGVDPSEPFLRDCLARKPEVENLTFLVKRLNSPAVLAINSPWGTGKTTFVKMWAAYLKSQNMTPLYFNAWETDFASDPLIAFLGELNAQLTSSLSASSQWWAKVKALSGKVASRGLPAAVRVITAGVLDASDLVEQEAAGVTGVLGADLLKSYEQRKAHVAEFKDALAKVVEQVADDAPLLVFVDELDRCRPDYAITLLERIKHLFDVPNLVFVLSMDREQLSHAVRAVYGRGFNATLYLRRFIDFEYELRRPSRTEFVDATLKQLVFGDWLLARQKKYPALRQELEHFSSVVGMLADGLDLGLRSIEQLLSTLGLACMSAEENHHIHAPLLAYLVVLKTFNPQLYKQFAIDTGDPAPAIQFLHATVPNGRRDHRLPCALVEGLILAARNAVEIESAHEELVGDQLDRDWESDYSRTVLHVRSNPTEDLLGRVSISRLVRLIELVDRIKLPE